MIEEVLFVRPDWVECYLFEHETCLGNDLFTLLRTDDIDIKVSARLDVNLPKRFILLISG